MGGPSTYRDFDVAVTRRGDHLEVRVLDSPAGETSAVHSNIDDGLTRTTLGNGGHQGSRDVGAAAPAMVDRANAQTGHGLFEALFHGDVLTRYRESVRRAVEAGDGLRLVLRFGAGADTLPWELLWDPEHRRFLALDPLTPIVRCIEMPTRAEVPSIGGPLRVLIAVSTPAGLDPLDVAHERRTILRHLDPLSIGDALEVQVIEDASLDGIRRALDRADVHVFHYIGHGTRLADGRSALALTAADGSVSTRSAEDVAAVLAAAPTLRLVVLNSCHGDATDEADPFVGTAASLVKVGLPAVIAMRRTISDRAAIAFASAFYEDLVSGARIERAITRGRAALFAADGPISTEWSTVALHLGSSLDADMTATPFPRLDDDVQFTVSSPRELRAAQWEPMLVFAHHGERFQAASGTTVDQRAEVDQRIAGFFGAGAAATTTADAGAPLPRGAGLTVVPDLPDVDCNPARQPITWSGEVAEVSFLLRASHSRVDSTIHGWVRVFCGPLVIAETEVELAVVAQGSPTVPAAPAEQPVHRYQRIFPCFSRKDEELVAGVVAVAEALGDRYMADVATARDDGAPDEWMLSQVPEADVFQLFWSTHSMASTSCRRQWEAAAAVEKDDFIRPLYWEEPFPRADGLPPDELAALRFVRLPGPTRTTAQELWRDVPAPPAGSFTIGAQPHGSIVAGHASYPAEEGPPPAHVGLRRSRAPARGLIGGALLILASSAFALLGGATGSAGLVADRDGDSLSAALLVAAFFAGVVLVVAAFVRWLLHRQSEVTQ